MYCANCGSLLDEDTNFCKECGEKIAKKESNSKEETPSQAMEVTAEDSDLLSKDLLKAVKRAGDSVFAIGIFGIVVSVIAEFIFYFDGGIDGTTLVMAIIIDAIIFGLLINWGNGLKKDLCNDLPKTYKKVNTIIIYTFSVIILELILGNYPGLLMFLMLIDLFRAKKQLKETLL